LPDSNLLQSHGLFSQSVASIAQHGIDCIVIEGDDGKVAGTVSERDIMRAIGQAGSKVFSGGQCALRQAKRCTDF
jgi:CBS domain-containing protein